MRGEGLSVEVDDIVTYMVVPFNDKIYVAAADCVMHIKGLQATFIFS